MKEDKKHKKRMEGLFEELNSYCLFREDKYQWTSLVHILLWEEPEKTVEDHILYIGDGPSDQETWVKQVEKEAKKGYINELSNSEKFYFDFENKIPENVILAIYLGTNLERDAKAGCRKILYKKKGLDLKKAVKLLKWGNDYDKTINAFKEMEKPPVFFEKTHESFKKEKPYSELGDLMK